MKKIGRTLHLWLGLVCGTIFVVLGLTGTALTWMPELDRALNPELLQARPAPGVHEGEPVRVSPASVQAVFDRLESDPGYGRPTQMAFPSFAGDVYVASYRMPAGKSQFDLAVSRQVMVDPGTLRVLGERQYGESGLSRPLLMPTLFHLHRYLVAGEVGKTIVGIAGIVMVVMALTGLVLWWPKPGWASLKSALTVRYGGSLPKLNYSLHRAGGFFLVPALLVQGFSGGYMNLPAVISPVVNAVAPVTGAGKVLNRDPEAAVSLDLQVALARAQAVFPDARTTRIAIPKAGAPYEVRVRQEGELRHDDGATRISIDSASGEVLRVIDPLNGKRGDAFQSWMFPLHTGDAYGMAGRVFISLFGLTPLIFMVTGVVIWLKQRRGKQLVRARQAAAAAA